VEPHGAATSVFKISKRRPEGASERRHVGQRVGGDGGSSGEVQRVFGVVPEERVQQVHMVRPSIIIYRVHII